ncbi:hypothetical protein GGR56DRAFT_346027 [Xylariaceae sp. FL0804]|nr:hypothetical protein GGR56DRAFT_346027 [Xylariaceae sp. FL0804]
MSSASTGDCCDVTGFLATRRPRRTTEVQCQDSMAVGDLAATGTANTQPQTPTPGCGGDPFFIPEQWPTELSPCEDEIGPPGVPASPTSSDEYPRGVAVTEDGLSNQPASAVEGWRCERGPRQATDGTLDSIMKSTSLQSANDYFCTTKASVDVAVRGGMDIKDEEFGVVLLGNPGTGMDAWNSTSCHIETTDKSTQAKRPLPSCTQSSFPLWGPYLGTST